MNNKPYYCVKYNTSREAKLALESCQSKKLLHLNCYVAAAIALHGTFDLMVTHQ